MTNDWLTPYKLTRPIEPRPCEICGKIVDGSFRYKPTGELAHMSCIINPQPPKTDDEDLTWAILKRVDDSLRELVLGLDAMCRIEKERNDMLRDAYAKEKVQ